MKNLYKKAYLNCKSTEGFHLLRTEEKTTLFLEYVAQNATLLKGWRKINYLLDCHYQSSSQEYIDLPHFDIEKKLKIIHGLHTKNQLFGTYKKMIRVMLPILEKIYSKEKRPVRVLEIASGSGHMLFGLYHLMKTKKINFKIQLTGSDIVPEYVLYANEKARQNNDD